MVWRTPGESSQRPVSQIGIRGLCRGPWLLPGIRRLMDKNVRLFQGPKQEGEDI
jgi:hypothetical protein